MYIIIDFILYIYVLNLDMNIYELISEELTIYVVSN